LILSVRAIAPRSYINGRGVRLVRLAVPDLPQGKLAMSRRLIPVALLLGTSSALAFDTSKLGQWGGEGVGLLEKEVGMHPA
jgi:hypothetical protein